MPNPERWSLTRGRNPDTAILAVGALRVGNVRIIGAGPAAVVRVALEFDTSGLDEDQLLYAVGFATAQAMAFARSNQVFPAEIPQPPPLVDDDGDVFDHYRQLQEGREEGAADGTE